MKLKYWHFVFNWRKLKFVATVNFDVSLMHIPCIVYCWFLRSLQCDRPNPPPAQASPWVCSVAWLGSPGRRVPHGVGEEAGGPAVTQPGSGGAWRRTREPDSSALLRAAYGLLPGARSQSWEAPCLPLPCLLSDRGILAEGCTSRWRGRVMKSKAASLAMTAVWAPEGVCCDRALRLSVAAHLYAPAPLQRGRKGAWLRPRRALRAARTQCALTSVSCGHCSPHPCATLPEPHLVPWVFRGAWQPQSLAGSCWNQTAPLGSSSEPDSVTCSQIFLPSLPPGTGEVFWALLSLETQCWFSLRDEFYSEFSWCRLGTSTQWFSLNGDLFQKDSLTLTQHSDDAVSNV